jgi:flagellar M-ring protein FliF
MMRGIGTARLIVMGLVGLFLVGFFIFLMTRMSAEPMSLLYSELPPSDAGAIGQKLDALKIPYEVGPDGTSIKVPTDQVGKARMTLAQAGLPSGGSIGYEIFDQNQGFGTTSFMQNLNQMRALEGELARTVSSLAPVKSARIHLVLPKRELFSHDEQAATASVMLTLRPGASLSHEQVSAIQHLIASAVPQLKSNQVSIVDDRGNMLARPEEDGDGDGDAEASANADERRHAYENRLTKEIETLVGQSVGEGKVRATVTADMDFDRISTSQESFDPDQQVVRSTQTTDEQNQSQDAQSNNSVSVANNLPPTQTSASSGSGPSSSSKGNKSEEVTNYEIGKTTRSQIREGGQVKKLSIAVLVDGTYTADKDGKMQYAPRSKEEMAQIEAVVRSATGYDAKRGDVIDVANMRFVSEVDANGSAPETTLMGFERSDLVHLAETAVLGVVALLVVLLVVRPVVNRLLPGGPATADGAAGNAMGMLASPAGAAGAGGPAALTGPAGTSVEAMEGNADYEEDSLIDLARVEGRVRVSSLRKIGEIVDKHPGEAVSILRGWMYQES